MPQLPRGDALIERRCARCGYGVAVREAPERCPMCGGTAWTIAASGRSLDEPVGTRELYDRLLMRAIEEASQPEDAVAEVTRRGPATAPRRASDT